MNISVKITKLRKSAILPKYATEGSAAADLCADLDVPLTLKPGERALVPTGLAIAPESSEVVSLIFSRSGMGAKSGISLANSVGVIDADYRGELKVALINHGQADYTVNPGDRVAQLMFVPVLHAMFEETDCLDQTERGAGGFGSTGRG